MDLDEQFLQNQTRLLQEIRDELRSTRAASTAQATGASSYGFSATPGFGTFSRAQTISDQVLSGQWNTLNWANAYKPTYQSSFGRDILALTGFGRAPETLTQSEYEQLAGQSVGLRVSRTISGFFAPEYTRQTTDFAANIQQNSSRFIRFGNPNASNIFGAGFDQIQSNQLARAVNYEALGNLRLSQNDYQTIANTGMQAGQFNEVSSTEEFRLKVRELAAATEELTRSLKLVPQEVANAMGTLRMMGVRSVEQQTNILRYAGSAGLVAGMSPTEMLGVATRAGATANAMGLSTEAGAIGAMDAAMQLRTMSSQGLLTQNDIARGGGIAAIAENQRAAIERFAMSDQGFLMFRGGGGQKGVGAFGAMGGALGNLSYNDLVSFQMDRYTEMQKATPRELNNLFKNMIDTQLDAVGTGLNEKGRRGMAFSMAMDRGMGPVEAEAFVTANYTEEGRKASENAEWQQRRAERYNMLKNEDDLEYTRSTIGGRLKAAENSWAREYHSALDMVFSGTDTAGNQFSRAHAIDLAAVAAEGGGPMTTAERLSAERAGSASQQYLQVTPKAGGRAVAAGMLTLNPLLLIAVGLGLSGPTKTEIDKQLEARLVVTADALNNADRQRGNALADAMPGVVKGDAWNALLSTNFDQLSGDADKQLEVNSLFEQALADNSNLTVGQNGERLTAQQLADILATRKDNVTFGLKSVNGHIGQTIDSFMKSPEQKANEAKLTNLLGEENGWKAWWNQDTKQVNTGIDLKTNAKEVNAYLRAMRGGDEKEMDAARRMLAGAIGEDKENILFANIGREQDATITLFTGDKTSYYADLDAGIAFTQGINDRVNQSRLRDTFESMVDSASSNIRNIAVDGNKLDPTADIARVRAASTSDHDIEALGVLFQNKDIAKAVDNDQWGAFWKDEKKIFDAKDKFSHLDLAGLKALNFDTSAYQGKLADIDKDAAAHGEHLTDEERGKKLMDQLLSERAEREQTAPAEDKDSDLDTAAGKNQKMAADALERLVKLLDIKQQ